MQEVQITTTTTKPFSPKQVGVGYKKCRLHKKNLKKSNATAEE
jgi:hypothetical protein